MRMKPWHGVALEIEKNVGTRSEEFISVATVLEDRVVTYTGDQVIVTL